MNTSDIERLLCLSMEAEVIRSLLAGNDTQCFTSQQYANARDVWIAKVAGASRVELGLDQPPNETNRKQLAASRLVKEVGPDIWALREDDNDCR